MKPEKNRYFRLGLMLFLSASAILLFYDTLFGSRVLPGIGGQFLEAFKPILYGAFLAYLLTPAVNGIERTFFRKQLAHARAQGRYCSPGVRAVSVLLAWILGAIVVFLLLSVLLPQLYESVNMLAGNLQSYYDTIYGWTQKLFLQFPDTKDWVIEQLNDLYSGLQDYVSNFLSEAHSLMAAAGRGVINVFTFLKNLLVGVIVSVYFMTAKESCGASLKKVLFSVTRADNAEWILRAVRRADGIFSGFVRGKVLDSFIMGVLCFLGCLVLNLPYAPLVSVIVGITNIIPFFGPFLGAIPSAFLIFLVSPIQALYFVVFVLALQQLDGNIIGPRILGQQTGLSSLWVIIAILVGGSFFGIPGMFFGVPVCGCLYAAGAFFVEQRLNAAGLPTDAKAYAPEIAETSEPLDTPKKEKKEKKEKKPKPEKPKAKLKKPAVDEDDYDDLYEDGDGYDDDTDDDEPSRRPGARLLRRLRGKRKPGEE